MWRARPVFISSTFLDMQAERDHLRTHVFPALEERLRERRYFLEWVDLRLGVAASAEADEGARELNVLKVCLAEVKRSRPFLIVLLGDRYGWIPPPDRIAAMEAAAAEEGFSGNIVGRSVTDLEIDFGVLSDPEQAPRSIFYFRAPLPYSEMPAEVAARYSDAHAGDPNAPERSAKLAALKKRIETRLPGRMVPYSVTWDVARQRVIGLDAFGQMVLEDIWAELDQETAPTLGEAVISWQQAERRALDEFSEDRARDFVGRETTLARLNNFCFSATRASPIWGACVTGEPGAGKSTLFSELYRCRRDGDAFVLAHAAGASPQAASVNTMLRRFIDELAAALGVATALEEHTNLGTVEATFASLLRRMAEQRRVIVLIDALDQFEKTSLNLMPTELSWLPHPWPENARFIATAISSDAVVRLLDNISLPPLDVEEARAIIVGICNRYHRTFESAVIDALLAKTGAEPAAKRSWMARLSRSLMPALHGNPGPAWGNPLWLVLAVEELNLINADDFDRMDRSYSGTPADRLRLLMLDTVAELPAGVPALYQQIFERAEELFGAGLVRAFLGALAISRTGWRESDFRILLPRISGEPWDELRFASLRRLFRGQLRRRGAHAQWDFDHTQMRAAVLTRLAANNIRISHLHTLVVDHLLSCHPDDPLRISETMFHLLGSEDWARAVHYYGDTSLNDNELDGANRVLADNMLAKGLKEFLLGASGIDDSTTRCLAMNRFTKACDLILHELDVVHYETDRGIVGDVLGDTFMAEDKLDEALEAYRDSLAIAARLAATDRSNTRWQRDLSVLYEKVGNVLAAQSKRGAYRDTLAVRERLAVKAYREGLAIRERVVAADSSNLEWQCDLALSHGRLASIYERQGQNTDALQELIKGRDIMSAVVAITPGSTQWKNNLAQFERQIARLQDQAQAK